MARTIFSQHFDRQPENRKDHNSQYYIHRRAGHRDRMSSRFRLDRFNEFTGTGRPAK